MNLNLDLFLNIYNFIYKYRKKIIVCVLSSFIIFFIIIYNYTNSKGNYLNFEIYRGNNIYSNVHNKNNNNKVVYNINENRYVGKLINLYCNEPYNDNKENSVLITDDQSNNNNNSSELIINDQNDNKKYAYVTYAAEGSYICPCIIALTSINDNIDADKVIIYDSLWENLDENSSEKKLLSLATNKYGIKCIPFNFVNINFNENSTSTISGNTDVTWLNSLLKISIFSLDQYKRIIYFDSDITFRNKFNLDILFNIKDSNGYYLQLFADPYWLSDVYLGTFLMAITPDRLIYKRLFKFAKEKKQEIKENDIFDMDLINDFVKKYPNDLYTEKNLSLNMDYNYKPVLISAYPFFLLSGDLRKDENHQLYAASSYSCIDMNLIKDDNENENEISHPEPEWDIEKIFNNVNLVHYSDWPLSKPWVRSFLMTYKSYAPTCDPDCIEKSFWLDVYNSYLDRKNEICVL